MFASTCGGFAREHIDAVHTKPTRRLLLGCGAKTVKTLRDVHVLTTDALKVGHELCLRQSAGNSTGPQIDVAASVLGKLDIQGNVSQMQTAAGLQDADDLSEALLLLGDQVQYAV
jgi:hypothetical protein